MTLSEELQWRGFVNQTTFTDIKTIDEGPLTFYLGVDPSAASMTIGNLAVVMMVRHFAAAGHNAIVLVGGATGMIGDPDGKNEERELKSLDEVQKNAAGIAAQYKQLLGDIPFEIVNNYDWFKDIGYLQFLRDVGKHVPMRQMLGRDFIQTRLGEEGNGISYAEFSYALIQGYDFLHLNREKGATLQIAGSDQWGNSIAGVELIRRITGKEANVWTAPLVINKSTGVKFGKSEDGAVWLDPSLTSVYKFYQFWLNVDDEGVGDYLKIYTLISPETYQHVMSEFDKNRAGRIAQKTLAYEVTKLVHGQERADSVKRVSETLFGGADYAALQPQDFEVLTTELPATEVRVGDDFISTLVTLNLASSNSEARRFLEQGAVYVNGQQIAADRTIEATDALHGCAIVRRGKNAHAVLQIST